MKFKQFSVAVMTGCMVLACAGCGTSGENQSTNIKST